jgi:hypothetical protein
MKSYAKIFLCLGLIITLTFFLFCISQAKSEIINTYNNVQTQEEIHVRQQQIKERLDRIEKKMKKRKKQRNKKKNNNVG